MKLVYLILILIFKYSISAINMITFTFELNQQNQAYKVSFFLKISWQFLLVPYLKLDFSNILLKDLSFYMDEFS
jgi:hypothetical protein